jgi:hypothetical protein
MDLGAEVSKRYKYIRSASDLNGKIELQVFPASAYYQQWLSFFGKTYEEAYSLAIRHHDIVKANRGQKTRRWLNATGSYIS